MVTRFDTVPRGRSCSLSKNEFTTARFGGYTGRDNGAARGKASVRNDMRGAGVVAYEDFGSELLVVSR